MAQCPNCGANVRPNVSRCIKCGSTLEVAQPTPQPSQAVSQPASPPQQQIVIERHVVQAKKDPVIAALLSCLIVGLGQIYNGQAVKGILMFVACVFLWAVLLGWIVNIVAIVDAYASAKKINEGQ